MSQPAAGWYPDPTEPNNSRYWDGSRWTSETRPSEGLAAREGYKPKTGDEDELRLILQHGGYSTEPDFIIWGTSNEFVKATAVSRKLMGDGRDLYAFAAYPSYMVYAIGRVKSRNPSKLRSSDEVNVVEIPYSTVISVKRLPGFENLMSELVLDTGTSGDIIGDTLFGRGHKLHLTRKQASEQSHQIEELKNRVRVAQQGTTATAERTDIAQQIKELADMRESGLLSEEEFVAAKNKLLGN